jgi:two-component system cell cycle response regulator DivK
MKILYVEDDDNNVFVIKNRLGRVGYTIVIATDGEQGIAMAASEKPDLILMDLRMPGVDGWEATRRLKAAAETKRIPIIALSAHAMPGDREKALEAGCEDYDTKPIDFSRLRGKIEALLSTGNKNGAGSSNEKRDAP